MFSKLSRVITSQFLRSSIKEINPFVARPAMRSISRNFSTASQAAMSIIYLCHNLSLMTAVAGGFCAASLFCASKLYANDNSEECEGCVPCEDECCPCHNGSTHPCTAEKKFVPGCHELKVFGGNGNPELTERVAKALGTKPGKIIVSHFNDGEVNIQIQESVRGKDVYIIQPTCPPVSDRIMELLLMVGGIRRASAKKITAIIPFYSYRRNTQKVTDSNNSSTSFIFSSAADIAKMIEVMGVDKVILVDMAAQVNLTKFDGAIFSNHIPMEVIDPNSLTIDYLKKRVNPSRRLVVIAPRYKDLSRAYNIRDELKRIYPSTEIVAFDLNYVKQINQTEGDDPSLEPLSQSDILKGSDVIIVDYAISMGRTMAHTANFVKEFGAKRVLGCVTHGLFLNQACDMLQSSAIEEIMVLDTVPIEKEKLEKCNKIIVVSIADKIADCIRDSHYIPKEKVIFKSD
ncbi:hypothetical protein WA158_002315 [Blastocystis sp. Blastoise]